MSEKITITFEGEAGKSYIVKPLGEKLAEETAPSDHTGHPTGTTSTDALGMHDVDTDVGI